MVKCKDYIMPSVFIDNGLTLNVLPKHIIDHLPIDASYMRPGNMMTKAYNGLSRQY